MSQSTHLVTWPLTDRDTISVPVTLVHVTRMRTTPTPPAARRPAIGMIMGPPSNRTPGAPNGGHEDDCATAGGGNHPLPSHNNGRPGAATAVLGALGRPCSAR